MPFITYPQTGGQVAVLFPADFSLTLEEIAAKDVPAGLPFKIVDTLDIDDEFFNAYDFDPNNGVAENIARAQDIQKNKWRTLRAPILAKLDIFFSMALEAGDTAGQATIAGQKQALRDVTDTPLPSDSIASIKAVVPEILTQTYSYTPPAA